VTAASSGGITPGTPAPVAGGIRPDGSRFSTDELEGRRSIVLFLSSTCEPCKALARELRRKLRREPLAAELVVVVRDEAERDALGLRGVDVVYQPDFSLAKGFATSATPHAFALNRDRVVVASSTPNTVRLLRELAASIPDGRAAVLRPRLAQASTDESGGR
jgi:thiol-disulfide isomerase/thioredoxin